MWVYYDKLQIKFTFRSGKNKQTKTKTTLQHIWPSETMKQMFKHGNQKPFICQLMGITLMTDMGNIICPGHLVAGT
jgi:hypothetical protein